MSRRLPFKVAGVYDTETTTLQDGARSVAFPCLYICNDIRDIDIAVYEAEISDDIRYYRYAGDVLEWLGDLMQWGYSAGVVPVVCTYNLMFDQRAIGYPRLHARSLLRGVRLSSLLGHLLFGDGRTCRDGAHLRPCQGIRGLGL